MKYFVPLYFSYDRSNYNLLHLAIKYFIPQGKNVMGILMGIVFNLLIASSSMIIVLMLLVPVKGHGKDSTIFFNLFLQYFIIFIVEVIPFLIRFIMLFWIL
jgi:hypothetical protein